MSNAHFCAHFWGGACGLAYGLRVWRLSQERLPADGPLLRHTLAIKKALANRYHTVVFPTVSRYSKDFPLDLLTLPNFL